ncbi:uncharacterized protein STEHIDRAFT_114974 [Stereum hirsutum FP-91666 SS1]|uniref:uncharacterized protein n=1 Tax=Stereum hirsutum (strain FP-91666) TaxID=721885 RepID=UPI0004449F44|nr:uncharacterized protein STEHIDRAFT_114974 [Stereum hirsutum FP-91666 SS1]EIM81551.1 hypothetical protein STEHIDRAFT_114974 [Stereum hirsutum FP-91666 SS1]
MSRPVWGKQTGMVSLLDSRHTIGAIEPRRPRNRPSIHPRFINVGNEMRIAQYIRRLEVFWYGWWLDEPASDSQATPTRSNVERIHPWSIQRHMLKVTPQVIRLSTDSSLFSELSPEALVQDVFMELPSNRLGLYALYPSFSSSPLATQQTLNEIDFRDEPFPQPGSNHQSTQSADETGSIRVSGVCGDEFDEMSDLSELDDDHVEVSVCDEEDDGLDWREDDPMLAVAIEEELDRYLPAHPNFALQGGLSSQTIRSQVSLKDVVMTRACSSNPDDLNRDPSVQRTYRRNAVTKRLESQDVQVQPASSTPSNGKRSAQFSTHQDVPHKKRRTSVLDGALSPPDVRMSNTGQGIETSITQTQVMYDRVPNTGTRPVEQDTITFASQFPVADTRQISPGLTASSNAPHGAPWAMPPANIPRSSMPTHRLPPNSSPVSTTSNAYRYGPPPPSVAAQSPRNSRTLEELKQDIDARKRKDMDIAKERSKKRLRDKTVNKAQQIHTDLQFSSLSISNKGWMGRRFDHDENVRMKRMWRDRTIESEMMGFQRVPFDSDLAKQPATDIRDCEGRLLCKRSMWRPRIADLVVQFGIEAVRHLDKTDPYPVVKVHTRGPHRFTICGVDRNNKKIPALNPWHVKNEAAITELFTPGSAVDQIQYKRCHEYIRTRYGINPMYGLFYNFCLNGAWPGKTDRVYCNFDHRRKAWLVIWEAGVIIEIPAGVFVAYPSSLFYHFNWDIGTICEIVTTQDGSKPTRENSEPLDGRDGRGSAVWFNQATMFQTSELGFNTVAEAEEAGADTTNARMYMGKITTYCIPSESVI